MALGRPNGQILEHKAALLRARFPDVALTEIQAMSMAQRAENVVDFADYRARRKGILPHAASDHVPYGPFMFAMPIMIPVVTWMPIWTSANVAGGESISK
jgi:hypothetical protein